MSKRNYGQFIDTHHCIQRALGGTNHSDNLVEMERRDHENHHRYLNMLLPHEQLFKVLQLNLTTFRHKYSRELYDVISSMDEHDVYKDNVIDRNRKYELERMREHFTHPKSRRGQQR